MLLRVLPLLIALALSLAPSSQAAVFVAAPPASAPPSTSENACTAFLPNESESRIGLLCHNDPVNHSDPMGLAVFGLYDSYGEYFADVGQVFIGEAKGAANILSLGLYQPSYSNQNQQLGGYVGQGLAVAGLAAATKAGPKSEAAAPAKGLGNPFKGKSPEQADAMMKGKGFETRGRDPVSGKGGYVNPKNDRSYHLDPKNRHGEAPHVDVNRPKGYDGPLEKKKLPLKENQ